MPVKIINRVLELELEPGVVILSRGAQRHAFRQHGEDYAKCQPHVSSIVAEPLYIGDDFKNHGKIELVGRVIAAEIIVLVAVNIERDRHGRYHIASFYPISEEKVQNRKRKGHLKCAF
ncbi:hypothetical protein A1351_09465 [Methylosinus sp. R-45379]|nr:hypothetical protein A1351_09465 [Methylosinus sp. R-45379]